MTHSAISSAAATKDASSFAARTTAIFFRNSFSFPIEFCSRSLRARSAAAKSGSTEGIELSIREEGAG